MKLLRVIDEDGEVFEAGDLETENRALRAALARAEKTITGLKANKEAARKAYVNAALIEEIFEDWKAKLVEAGFKSKRNCKLSDDRFDAIKAMVEAGYTLAHFGLVNTGIAHCPYEVYGKRRQHGSPDSLKVDIAHVCEKARRFEEAAQLGAIVERALKAEESNGDA